RDKLVTGVQTCALPICHIVDAKRNIHFRGGSNQARSERQHQLLILAFVRSNDELRLQQSLLLIEKENRKRVVVDLLLYGRCDLEIGRASCRERGEMWGA